jgi:hypothetical protein
MHAMRVLRLHRCEQAKLVWCALWSGWLLFCVFCTANPPPTRVNIWFAGVVRRCAALPRHQHRADRGNTPHAAGPLRHNAPEPPQCGAVLRPCQRHGHHVDAQHHHACCEDAVPQRGRQSSGSRPNGAPAGHRRCGGLAQNDMLL